jgi:hypothetical protein
MIARWSVCRLLIGRVDGFECTHHHLLVTYVRERVVPSGRASTIPTLGKEMTCLFGGMPQLTPSAFNVRHRVLLVYLSTAL